MTDEKTIGCIHLISLCVAFCAENLLPQIKRENDDTKKKKIDNRTATEHTHQKTTTKTEKCVIFIQQKLLTVLSSFARSLFGQIDKCCVLQHKNAFRSAHKFHPFRGHSFICVSICFIFEKEKPDATKMKTKTIMILNLFANFTVSRANWKSRKSLKFECKRGNCNDRSHLATLEK